MFQAPNLLLEYKFTEAEINKFTEAEIWEFTANAVSFSLEIIYKSEWLINPPKTNALIGALDVEPRDLLGNYDRLTNQPTNHSTNRTSSQPTEHPTDRRS